MKLVIVGFARNKLKGNHKFGITRANNASRVRGFMRAYNIPRLGLRSHPPSPFGITKSWLTKRAEVLPSN